ncbi:putative crystal protein [Zalerion maritima]|uniref:Crystal protein n=1 Tax=Zalerion maritima TaxID=339359 RepID=A0AAD5WUN2_9PEZI|nr:putative crystal protein [Zalerion maritima]
MIHLAFLVTLGAALLGATTAAPSPESHNSDIYPQISGFLPSTRPATHARTHARFLPRATSHLRLIPSAGASPRHGAPPEPHPSAPRTTKRYIFRAMASRAELASSSETTHVGFREPPPPGPRLSFRFRGITCAEEPGRFLLFKFSALTAAEKRADATEFQKSTGSVHAIRRRGGAEDWTTYPVTTGSSAYLLSSGFEFSPVPDSLFPAPEILSEGNETLALYNMASRLARDGIFRCIDQATVYAALAPTSSVIRFREFWEDWRSEFGFGLGGSLIRGYDGDSVGSCNGRHDQLEGVAVAGKSSEGSRAQRGGAVRVVGFGAGVLFVSQIRQH